MTTEITAVVGATKILVKKTSINGDNKVITETPFDKESYLNSLAAEKRRCEAIIASQQARCDEIDAETTTIKAL